MIIRQNTSVKVAEAVIKKQLEFALNFSTIRSGKAYLTNFSKHKLVSGFIEGFEGLEMVYGMYNTIYRKTSN
ncbi:hypothetical protein ABUE38_09900 [Pediococcus parvulus]|uniref:Uncharacterized protein n=1 Tax=Pediococcus parvulus TaxID=54062 RepID=A0ABX2UGE2_9LACO|nr:hypothetical protein [Pediococcus parvulus]MCT3031155.1 hypothetical protein [Pediococcus parvulus]MCT3035347.1 hypothetical protein [Pediococcus parvulus]OAD63968.1 hypothetical protein A7K95_07330 [Pediococcus parvulus]HBO47390.1 hypothetical protein [Pediococcus sp.]